MLGGDQKELGVLGGAGQEPGALGLAESLDPGEEERIRERQRKSIKSQKRDELTKKAKVCVEKHPTLEKQV